METLRRLVLGSGGQGPSLWVDMRFRVLVFGAVSICDLHSFGAVCVERV
jgi:hypothetical protein